MKKINEIFVFTKGIDFFATKDNKHYYFQITYSVAEAKAYKREMGAFRNKGNLSQKILITNGNNIFIF